MPVRVWATSARRRGRIGTPRWWISWAIRWIAMARKPGYAAMTSSIDSAAGSPARDRLGVEDEAGVDLGQRFREGVHDARRVGLPGERCDETAQVAAGDDEVSRQLVRAGGGVVGELREEDAEEPVRERGDVALERIEAAVLGAARGEELRERVLAVVLGGRGHGLLHQRSVQRMGAGTSGAEGGSRVGRRVGSGHGPPGTRDGASRGCRGRRRVGLARPARGGPEVSERSRPCPAPALAGDRSNRCRWRSGGREVPWPNHSRELGIARA